MTANLGEKPMSAVVLIKKTFFKQKNRFAIG